MRRPKGCASGWPPRARRCRCSSACATGIRSSPTRSRRWRGPASDARWASSPRRTAATRAARSTARTSGTRGPQLARAGLPDVEVTYVPDWYSHPLFIDANAERVCGRDGPARTARARRCAARVHGAQHSRVDGARYPYRAQFEETARLVAEPRAAQSTITRRCIRAAAAGPRIRGSGPTSATTSAARARAGSRPRSSARSASSAITSRCSTTSTSRRPRSAATIGLPMARAQAVNDHPRFLDMMADVVLGVCRRYERARPLELVPAV